MKRTPFNQTEKLLHYIDPYEIKTPNLYMYARTMPIKTVSEANSREHWAKKGTRHTMQKMAVHSFMRVDRPEITTPCTIKLTRIAPRKLDKYENLPMSFKYILDAICEYIHPGLAPGRADDDPNINVTYAQEKGEPRDYAIRIEITKSQSCS